MKWIQKVLFLRPQKPIRDQHFLLFLRKYNFVMVVIWHVLAQGFNNRSIKVVIKKKTAIPDVVPMFFMEWSRFCKTHTKYVAVLGWIFWS